MAFLLPRNGMATGQLHKPPGNSLTLMLCKHPVKLTKPE
ncbi:hypothetical protein [Klebsiella pneumoniae IS46]|nr:hypothetical protein [Klebsiella pneumoniae IS46]